MTSYGAAVFGPDSPPRPGEDATGLWQSALEHLQERLTAAVFDCCLKESKALAWEDDVLTIGLKTPYARERVQHNLLETVQGEVSRLLDRPVEIRLVLLDDERVGELRGGISSRRRCFQEPSSNGRRPH